MTLTKTQIFHRTDSLSGEIKAAREAQGECRRALADQERLTTIAAQAVERADARVIELEAERAELAEQARVAILGVGEPLEIEAEPLNVFSNEFYQSAMANGEAKVAEAFDRATS